jgi:diguanylate cyclase (GGDEF)-like protein
MSYQAQHDFLTGLPNRLLLTDRLTQAIALSRRRGNKVALLFLDLDPFKLVNDSRSVSFTYQVRSGSSISTLLAVRLLG